MPTTALVKYDPESNSLRKAIDLCEGFESLRSEDKVLIKPNIVSGFTPDRVPYGITTTPDVLRDLVNLLRDRGCKNITIGEGPTSIKGIDVPADWAFEWSGIKDLTKELEVDLVDLNDEGYVKTEMRKENFWIAKRALEADFLINVPVLKTHSTAVVSLGLKNMKGCLNLFSKKKFHRKGLHGYIAELGTKIKPELTIIDGIYGLERGPMSREHHRLDLIIASRDALSADMVGSAVMGIDPKSVPHLREFAKLTGRELDLGKITMKGEKIEEVSTKMEWELPWNGMTRKRGIKGITIQEPLDTVCTGCGLTVWIGMSRFFWENQGVNFDDVEFCVGLGPKARKDKNVLLFGACAMATNRDLKNAFKLKGCPPTIDDTYLFIRESMAKIKNSS